MHAPHLGMLGQEFGDALRVLILPRHAHGQRLQPAHQHPRGVRIHAIAQGRTRLPDSFDQFVASGDDAANQVGVSGQIFRSGMHDQVDAEFRRCWLMGVPKVASIMLSSLCAWPAPRLS